MSGKKQKLATADVQAPSRLSIMRVTEGGEQRMMEEATFEIRTLFYLWFHDNVQQLTERYFFPLIYQFNKQGKKLSV